MEANTIATMVTPSNGRSRTPIRTIVPMVNAAALRIFTAADDAASRSSKVSEARVTNSPTDRDCSEGTVAARNRLTSEDRASKTTFSAAVPRTIH
ncbi:hypothetical protein GCM10020255_017760 [Rhodococcus baikonurensis]